MTSRRDRACEVLATELERNSLPGEHLWIVADQFRRNVDKETNNAVIRAILAFADAELERAATKADDHCEWAQRYGLYTNQSIADDTSKEIAQAIRAMKED